jgi:YidC/Oxa1 family membrane protein insertase
MFEAISWFFDNFLIDPLTNLFVLLSHVTGSAGIGVILLTIIIRIVTLPPTLRQMHTTRMMAVLQPRMAEIQRRYKDPRRRSQEQMKLYKDAGVNPLGCFSGMLIQFPILIALYRTFSLAVGEAPESFIDLHDRLYSWDYLRGSLPLESDFLWLHLGRPDPIILPVLVAATTYILQKVTMLPATDDRARAQASMMNMMMPLLFGWITISLPSGLGLYYVLSNVIGVVLQYAYVGGGPINWRGLVGLSQDPVLPRALEVRQMHIERVSSISRSDDDEEDDGEPGVGAKRGPRKGPSTQESRLADAAETGAAAARRRRSQSGRRRSRR